MGTLFSHVKLRAGQIAAFLALMVASSLTTMLLPTALACVRCVEFVLPLPVALSAGWRLGSDR